MLGLAEPVYLLFFQRIQDKDISIVDIRSSVLFLFV